MINEHHQVLALVSLEQPIEAEVGRDTRTTAGTGKQLCQRGSARALRRCLVVIEMKSRIQLSILTVQQIFQACQRILMRCAVGSLHQLTIRFLQGRLDGSRGEVFDRGFVIARTLGDRAEANHRRTQFRVIRQSPLQISLCLFRLALLQVNSAQRVLAARSLPANTLSHLFFIHRRAFGRQLFGPVEHQPRIHQSRGHVHVTGAERQRTGLAGFKNLFGRRANLVCLRRKVLYVHIKHVIAGLESRKLIRKILHHFFQGFDFLLRIFDPAGFIISLLIGRGCRQGNRCRGLRGRRGRSSNRHHLLRPCHDKTT